MKTGGPVFIAGCGRSGTSYLRTIVDAHPEVYIPSESLFIIDYLKYGDSLPGGILKWLFFREPQLRCWYEGETFDITDAASAVGRVHSISAEAKGASVWGQKTPRFVRHMELLDGAFPGARWILIYRDPRAVAASMKRSRQHTSSVVSACRRWLRDNGPILDILGGSREAGNVLTVRYEDLVKAYESNLLRIFDFLGLPPITADDVERMGKPVFFSRSRFRINTVRGTLKPDPKKIDGWKEVLSAREREYIERTCSAEMRIMGYEPSADRLPAAGHHFPLQRLKDLAIPFRYLIRWPEYPIHVLVRNLFMGLFRLLRPRSRS